MGSLPRKLILATSFVLLFGCGWFVASVLQQKNSQARTLSSVRNQSTIMMEKHLMPVTVSIVVVGEIPEESGELVTIKGQIKTPFDDFNSISYHWNLDESIEIVKGQAKGDIANPTAGHVYEVELIVKNFDKQYRKEINLQAYVFDTDGVKLGNSTVITSRPEDAMEHLAPMMMVKAQEAAAIKNRMPASEEEE